MARALVIVDVQHDFLDGGALPVPGGRGVASAISAYLRTNAADYAIIVGIRDRHEPAEDGDPRFGCAPAVDTEAGPAAHCVARTHGAAFADELNTDIIDVTLVKGIDGPVLSAFDATVPRRGTALASVLADHGVDSLDIVGLRADLSVRATALDATHHVREVRVLTDLIAPADDADLESDLKSAGVIVTAAPESHRTKPVWPSFPDDVLVDAGLVDEHPSD